MSVNEYLAFPYSIEINFKLFLFPLNCCLDKCKDKVETDKMRVKYQTNIEAHTSLLTTHGESKSTFNATAKQF